MSYDDGYNDEPQFDFENLSWVEGLESLSGCVQEGFSAFTDHAEEFERCDDPRAKRVAVLLRELADAAGVIARNGKAVAAMVQAAGDEWHAENGEGSPGDDE
ncbi:hypothetical protein [Rosistilla oblonga]|uniref:Uncharacterized protein n=1 Tax=Rosistilla oblonga TaxID=2527990 RepID=A0A518IQV7_9BACT|nr:hypothetical protein [Rosistilla oblonga]QDV55478.1 hypothetical protein Mal33_14530 [Rosistilla oblonga]